MRQAALTLALLPAGLLAAAPATGATRPGAAATAGTTVGGSGDAAGPDATTETVAALRAAGLRVAVAVTDTTTGATTTAGEATALFPSESVVKVLIAARLAAEGRVTGAVAERAAAMLSASDDDAASALWGEVGGPEVVAWASARYGVTGLAAPSEWGWWGNTKVSASGLAALYTALAADPQVAPWLTTQLAALTPVATDGTDQTFGFGAAAVDGTAAVKQGWGGDDDAESTANLLSTGYLAAGRFAVAVIVQDPRGGATRTLVPAIDDVAAAVTADTAAVLDTETARAAAACDGCAGGSAAPTPSADRDLAVASAAPEGSRSAASAPVLGLAGFLVVATAVVSAWLRRRAAARSS